ncbi:MAG: TrkH family potassium uptake protein, partial [Flavobacterium sp.]
FDFGVNIHRDYKEAKFFGLFFIVIALLVFNILKIFHYKVKAKKKIAKVNATILTLMIVVSSAVYLFNTHISLFYLIKILRPILEIGLIFYFIIRLMALVRIVYEKYNNPSIIFVGSFFIVILIGAFLLLLPTATYKEISFTDALFTSTSAVCVTGLNTLDTELTFTRTGQIIIITLIQIGGLGILTFTSFFSYFFRSSSSFKENINIKDFVSEDNLGNVFKTALNIVIFTLSVEVIGAILMFFTIFNINEIEDKFFYSIFHSVSAFCNAGFSTYSAGLNENFINKQYSFQWIIMFLIAIGGLGYNIVYNYWQYIKNYFKEIIQQKQFHVKNHIVTINTKIVFYTTLFLIFGGFIILFFTEYNNSLLQHTTVFGKITTTMFNSITPRTAGFNTMNYAEYSSVTILIMIFLMWVGASPASTGGGIKTSTFALATLNIINIAKGRTRINIFGRRISSDSTNRAFAIISLSLIVIGLSIVGLLIFEPKNTDLMSIVFECFSAYSTVGLSLNFTPTLTDPSKYVLIVTMFIGRIGMLNLIIGLLREVNSKFYDYPKDNILIN